MVVKAEKPRVKGKCPYCGVPVKEENLPKHLRSVHPGRQEALDLAKQMEVEARRAKPKARGPAYGGGRLAGRTLIALVIAIVVIAAGVAAYVFIPRAPPGPDPELTAPIGSICYDAEARPDPAQHRHTLLHIFFNGQSVNIPHGIGIPRAQAGLDSCWRPVHTHLQDTVGLLHIEPRIPRAYTLGDFFDLWALNQPDRTIRFDATHILDKDISANSGSIRVQVGQADIPGQNYRTQPLADPALPTSETGHIYIYYTGP